LDHQQWVFGGLYHSAKFGYDRCSSFYKPPAHRCPRRHRQRQRQRVTEGTAMAPWNGSNHIQSQSHCLSHLLPPEKHHVGLRPRWHSYALPICTKNLCKCCFIPDVYFIFCDQCLARSAKLPEGLYILPMFFLYFFYFFVVTPRAPLAQKPMDRSSLKFQDW